MNKKREQLGIDSGTATSILKKMIMFDMAKKLGLIECHQCGKEIETVSEFSVEHKIPWLDSESPQELFFDLNNIAFSHLSCNIGAARQTKQLRHPSVKAYKNGCRCEECKAEWAKKIARQRVNRKLRYGADTNDRRDRSYYLS